LRFEVVILNLEKFLHMQRKAYTLFIIVEFLFFIGCGEGWIEKPKGLIPEKKMVEILVDLHIADAVFLETSYKPGHKLDLKAEDFYYSVLNKYNVADSVFEKSVIYYANFPKDFEKIYAEVLDKVSQLRDSYSQKESQPVNMGQE